MAVFCHIDWAEGHHDVALVDGDGRLLAKRRIAETPDGFTELPAMLAAAGDRADAPIPVALETPRGLLVAALRPVAARRTTTAPVAPAVVRSWANERGIQVSDRGQIPRPVMERYLAEVARTV